MEDDRLMTEEERYLTMERDYKVSGLFIPFFSFPSFFSFFSRGEGLVTIFSSLLQKIEGARFNTDRDSYHSSSSMMSFQASMSLLILKSSIVTIGFIRL